MKPSHTTTVTTSRCGRCGVEHVATSDSDYCHPMSPADPPFWRVGFTPPGEPNMSIAQWVCEACAKELGGPVLARQLEEVKKPRRNQR